MKEIQLGNRGIALIDDDDYHVVNNFKWCINKGGYARAHIYRNNKRTSVLMHRLILGLTDPEIHVDHKFHNKLDNRKSEIRVCTNTENHRNSQVKGKSIYKGVSFNKIIHGSKKYEYIIAKIRIDKKLKHLGTFKNEIDAALAYDNAAKVYFGEFANLNFK